MDVDDVPATGGDAARPQPEPSADFQYRKVYRLAGPTAACPSLKVLDGVVAAPSFDSTIRLFQLPAASYGGDGGAGGVEPEAVEARAVLTDASQHLGLGGHSVDQATCVNCVALEGGARRLVSGGNDLQVKLWDVEASRVVLRLLGHQGWVWPVAALGEGLHSVLTGGTDGSVRLWDLRAGRQAAALDIGRGTDGARHAPRRRPRPQTAVHPARTLLRTPPG
jgi:WD40 repeat protein